MSDPPIAVSFVRHNLAIATQDSTLHLSPCSIRSLEFWFNHLYNHEGNTQNPALPCQLNTGESWEDQEGAAALLCLQSLAVGRRTTQAFISRLGLLPKSFPSLCYVRAWEPGGYSGNLEVRVARSLSSELKVAA